MMKKTLLLTAAVFGFGFTALAQVQTLAPAAQAQRLPAFTHINQVENDLARISAKLDATASYSGRFAQYASDGSFSQGNIYLKRPGKIRFEYDAPAPMLLVSDGVTLTQLDRQLGTKDRIPLKATPLEFFLAENVDLANDVEVISLQKTPTRISVTAKDGSGEVDGSITMVFDPQSLYLTEWIVHDGFGQETKIILSALTYNQRLNPRLFVLRDDSRRDRRR
ncbi:MAG: outer membrane lipoprotein carrier protein LolA [Robiginitomaculum sp.]|nr:outer membrane lipoprotein carrier protein LolA [Robiginitomaculum sp.]